MSPIVSTVAQEGLNNARFIVGPGLANEVGTTNVKFMFFLQSNDGAHSEFYKVDVDFGNGGNYNNAIDNVFDINIPTEINVGDQYVANFTIVTDLEHRELIEKELTRYGAPDLSSVDNNSVGGLPDGATLTLGTSVTDGSIINPGLSSLTLILNILNYPQCLMKHINTTEYGNLKKAAEASANAGGSGDVVVDLIFSNGDIQPYNGMPYNIMIVGENRYGKTSKSIDSLIFSDTPGAAYDVMFYSSDKPSIAGRPNAHSATLKFKAQGRTAQTNSEVKDTLIALYRGGVKIGQTIINANAEQRRAGEHNFVYVFDDLKNAFSLISDLDANETVQVKIKRRSWPTSQPSGITTLNYTASYLSSDVDDVANARASLSVSPDRIFNDTYEVTLRQEKVLDMLEYARQNSMSVKKIIASDSFANSNSAFGLAGYFKFDDDRQTTEGETVGQLERKLTDLYNNDGNLVFDVEYVGATYKITHPDLIFEDNAGLYAIYGKTVTLTSAGEDRIGERIILAQGIVGTDDDLVIDNLIIKSESLDHGTSYKVGWDLSYMIETVADTVPLANGNAVQFISRTLNSRYESSTPPNNDIDIHKFLQGATTEIFNTNDGKTEFLNQFSYNPDLTANGSGAPYFHPGTIPLHKVRLKATHSNPMPCTIIFNAYPYDSTTGAWEAPQFLGQIINLATDAVDYIQPDTNLVIRKEYAITSTITSYADPSITEIDSTKCENNEGFGDWTTSNVAGAPRALSQGNMKKFKCLVSVSPSNNATLTLGIQKSNGKYNPTLAFNHSQQAAFFNYWNDNHLRLKAKISLTDGNDAVIEDDIEFYVDTGGNSTAVPTSNISNVLNLDAGTNKHSHTFNEVLRKAIGFKGVSKNYIKKTVASSTIFNSLDEIPLRPEQNESATVTPVNAPTVDGMAIGTDTPSGSSSEEYNVQFTNLKANGGLITSVAIILYGEDVSKSRENNNTIEYVPINRSDLSPSDIIGDDGSSTIYNDLMSNTDFVGDVTIRISPINFVPGSNTVVDGALAVISNTAYHVFASSEDLNFGDDFT